MQIYSIKHHVNFSGMYPCCSYKTGCLYSWTDGELRRVSSLRILTTFPCQSIIRYAPPHPHPLGLLLHCVMCLFCWLYSETRCSLQRGWRCDTEACPGEWFLCCAQLLWPRHSQVGYLSAGYCVVSAQCQFSDIDFFL